MLDTDRYHSLANYLMYTYAYYASFSSICTYWAPTVSLATGLLEYTFHPPIHLSHGMYVLSFCCPELQEGTWQLRSLWRHRTLVCLHLKTCSCPIMWVHYSTPAERRFSHLCFMNDLGSMEEWFAQNQHLAGPNPQPELLTPETWAVKEPFPSSGGQGGGLW